MKRTIYCILCGNEYSDEYDECPFCEEEEIYEDEEDNFVVGGWLVDDEDDEDEIDVT